MTNLDGVLGCALAVECRDAADQEDALTKFLQDNGGMNNLHSRLAATCVLKYFDLAEKGTLQAFKDSIARLARGEGYKPE